MSDLTWEAVLARTDLIGGYIRTYTANKVFAGPLAAIVADGDRYRFESPWRARYVPDGPWVTTKVEPIWSLPGGTPHSAPQQLLDHTVLFRGVGSFSVLSPQGTTLLEVDKVQGLPLAPQRLLKLFPDLPYDPTAAQQVCADKAFDWLAPELAALPVDATVHDLVSCFRHASSAEEFLWYYIERVTGERQIHHRVY